MSYQVLARKWRPHDFNSLLGQDHVVRALRHALTENRLHHAYLFTGTRGVGKTTISRILAKCLNCIGPDGKGGVTDEPCGVCEACRAIDEDRFVDYIEMDAASTRGIDDMVSLLERAKYMPSNARYKVYMIDEVHQLTPQAFAAMLKTLEEPPEYVKFILATTDPQKVPVTILSRCLQFNLKSLSPHTISEHMIDVLQKEGIEFEKGALLMLANGARGSMRDGLSLLDQAIAYSGGKVSTDAVRDMLGAIDSTTLVRLLAALANHDAAEMIAISDEIGARSLSYAQAIKDLALLLHQIAMAQRLPSILNEEVENAETLLKLSKAMTPEEVQLYYQIAINARNDMHLAPDEYAGFTMALLRMMAFAPANSTAKLTVNPMPTPRLLQEPVVPQTQVEQSTESVKGGDESKVAVAEKVKARESAAEKTEEKKVEIEEDPDKKESVPEKQIGGGAVDQDIPPWEEEDSDGPVFIRDSHQEKKTTEGAEDLEDEIESPNFSDNDIVDVKEENSVQTSVEFLSPQTLAEWVDVLRNIDLDGPVGALMRNADFRGFDGQQILLSIDTGGLASQDNVQLLSEKLQQATGKIVRLNVQISPSSAQSLADYLEREDLSKKRAKVEEFKRDDEVKSYLDLFDGTLDETGIKLADQSKKKVK